MYGSSVTHSPAYIPSVRARVYTHEHIHAYARTRARTFTLYVYSGLREPHSDQTRPPPPLLPKCWTRHRRCPALARTQRPRALDLRDVRRSFAGAFRSGRTRGKASEDDRVLSYLLGTPLERALLALTAAEAKAISTQVRWAAEVGSGCGACSCGLEGHSWGELPGCLPIQGAASSFTCVVYLHR